MIGGRPGEVEPTGAPVEWEGFIGTCRVRVWCEEDADEVMLLFSGGATKEGNRDVLVVVKGTATVVPM